LQILEKNLNGRGFKLMIDNLDDLWHLYNIIEQHDQVASKTYRRLEGADDKLRPDKVPKKLVWLAIDVQELEFHEFSNRLRVHGTIVKGPDELGLKAYHTLNFNPGDIIELEKPEPWRSHHMKILNDSVKTSKQPQVTMVALEDDNAVIAQLFQYGIRKLCTIEHSGSGKMYTGSKTGRSGGKSTNSTKTEFFDNIMVQLNQVRPDGSPLILIGPGFTKDEFFKFCKDKQLPGIDKVMLEPTGQSGMVGIQEAIKRGVVKRLTQDSRVALETELVDNLLEGIAKDGPVTYGLTQTKTAVDVGAVETLLVIDKLVRIKNEDVEHLMTTTEESGGKVVVISTVHDSGKQLDALGGIAAILRYKI
jgi:protein pelota